MASSELPELLGNDPERGVPVNPFPENDGTSSSLPFFVEDNDSNHPSHKGKNIEESVNSLSVESYFGKSRSFSSNLGLPGAPKTRLPRAPTTATLTTELFNKQAEITELPNECWQIYSDPPDMMVPRRMLLVTRTGIWLEQHDCLQKLILLLCFIVVALSLLLTPGAQRVEKVSRDGEAVAATIRWGTPLWITCNSLYAVFWVLLSHRINSHLLSMCFKTFDSWAIVSSFAVGEFVRLYNLHCSFGTASVYDVEWMVWDIISRVLIIGPLGIFLGAIDSVRLARWIKISLLVSCFMNYLWEFFWHREVSEEWTDEHRLFGEISLHITFLSTRLQIALFTFKALIAYLYGYHLAFVRPWYSPVQPTSQPGLVEEKAANAPAADYQLSYE